MKTLLMDMETRRILEEAVDEASNILKSYRLELDSLADLLCEHETVDGAQIDAILGQTEKQGEGKVFPGSAPNGHKPFRMVTRTNVDEQPKGKVDLDDLSCWENEGGQNANHISEGEASVSQGYSIKPERSPKNASV